MNQPFSPGGMCPTGYPPNWQPPQPAPPTAEEIQRERYQRENRIATVRISGIVLEDGEQTFLSRVNSRGEAIVDAPVRRLNEKFNGKRIDLGDGLAVTVRFAEYAERVG